MKKIFVCFFLLSAVLAGSAQTLEQIKADSKTYIYGDGSAATLEKADQYALATLISQISTQVESKFSMNSDWGSNQKLKETVNMVISTYSSATLRNAERIVISNEPDAKVVRYIRRDDVHKVFEQRKNKIQEFAAAGLLAEQNTQIADALRYYYWALTLLKSLPDANEIYMESNGTKNFLSTWLPVQMNNVFANLSFETGAPQDESEQRTIPLKITYKGKSVSNLDYSYWDGKDWTNLVSAKDGKGFLEFFGSSAKESRELKVKAEYVFKGEARIDKELDEVMKYIDPVPFRGSYYTLKESTAGSTTSANNSNFQANKQVNQQQTESNQSFDKIKEVDVAPYKPIVNQVLQAVKAKNYNSVKPLFTDAGFEMFQSLIAYGNAKILAEPDLKAAQCNQTVMCRSVSMSFSFKNNTKRFVEDVVFHFNEQKQIESISFGLGSGALHSVMGKEKWDEADRMQIINFLEHYKTAYALKRLDYIQSIFADDALIIVGSLVKAAPNVENQFKNNKIVKYNRFTKEQYIRNLKNTFAGNEFINIKFEDSDIRKSGKGGNVYGIQIKQNYFSTNYGDEGYLFLIVDLTNPKQPIIHVRTWQPEKNADGSIYGIEDF